MDSAKQQLAEKLKTANNILVTVSRDPSVDQLAACLGLTLLLNKLNKHSVAVFSGKVPSTIEFLKPDETIEKTTDSLRDFIIALDKSKADKLRYKVEDNVVRIFITPYKTSISQEDLEFSQGDFNVDVVIALGVKQQEDLDGAITAHGRILHDAAVASINTTPDGGLGSISWHDPQASSLSELVTELALLMGDNLLDSQTATALLTGIVAETGRFRNDKTSSQTMSASSALMAAGANQQLVATQLEEPPKETANSNDKPAGQTDDGKSPGPPKSDDGTLTITHDATGEEDAQKPDDTADTTPPKSETKPPAELPPPQMIGTADTMLPAPPVGDNLSNGSKLVTEPPALGGTLSANTQPEGLDPVTDPLSLPSAEPDQLLSRTPGAAPITPVSDGSPSSRSAATSLTPPPADWTPPPSNPSALAPTATSDNKSQTLSEIEASVHSPHVNPAQLDDARDEVSKALVNSVDTTPAPIQALNAKPLGDDNLHPSGGQQPATTADNSAVLPLGPAPPESADTNPIVPPPSDSLSPTPTVTDSTAPPPVPPPIPFQFGNTNNSGNPPKQQ